MFIYRASMMEEKNYCFLKSIKIEFVVNTCGHYENGNVMSFIKKIQLKTFMMQFLMEVYLHILKQLQLRKFLLEQLKFYLFTSFMNRALKIYFTLCIDSIWTHLIIIFNKRSWHKSAHSPVNNSRFQRKWLFISSDVLSSQQPKFFDKFLFTHQTPVS